MDLKYREDDWDKARKGIRNLIGLGVWGKGMIDELKSLSKNLDKAARNISKYDSDGVISFYHTNRDHDYDSLFEDFRVLENFTKRVGGIVDQTIDQPFHKDFDEFVAKMRDSSISNYSTTNRINATVVETLHYGYGMTENFERVKEEVTLSDLFTGDNFYSDQMRLEFEQWQELNPDQELAYEDYQLAAVNMNAFEYTSIKDTQLTKEFWVSIGALVVIVGVALICPPAGLTLGAIYGSYELTNAIVGKDLISQRELDTGERWLRGLLAPIDIIPAGAALKRFSGTTRTGTKLINSSPIQSIANQTKSIVNQTKGVTQQAVKRVDEMVRTASAQTTARLNSAKKVVSEQAIRAHNKVIDDILAFGRGVDSKLTTGKVNYYRLKDLIFSPSFATDMGSVQVTTSRNVKPVTAADNFLNAKLPPKQSLSSPSGSSAPVEGASLGKGGGSVKHLDDIPRIKEVEVNFKRNDKHDSEEFARQLKDQEKGMNELTVDEYLKNREKYIEQGRAIEGNAAQQATREKALNKKIEELFESGMSWEEAEIKANSWLKTQAALHNPDQIAGGNPLNIGGMGDKRINSSIGSQWKYRIDIVDEQIGELAKLMTPEQRKSTYLNIKLTH
ncbi:hypothetical protein BTS2_2012 [Bacillus sp. TS-2]|nr:hypothetical protein BTS2_2012 [Bacillus sp. TS-2]